MIEIKNTKVYGLEQAIKRSGYPTRYSEPEDYGHYVIGNNGNTEYTLWHDYVDIKDKD